MKVFRKTETKYFFHVKRHMINNRTLPLAEEVVSMFSNGLLVNKFVIFIVLFNGNTTIAKLGRGGCRSYFRCSLRTAVMETLANGC